MESRWVEPDSGCEISLGVCNTGGCRVSVCVEVVFNVSGILGVEGGFVDMVGSTVSLKIFLLIEAVLLAVPPLCLSERVTHNLLMLTMNASSSL